MRRPDDVFDRVSEWDDLAEFVETASPGLLVIFGRSGFDDRLVACAAAGVTSTWSPWPTSTPEPSRGAG
jgi:hypothetical protein